MSPIRGCVRWDICASRPPTSSAWREFGVKVLGMVRGPRPGPGSACTCGWTTSRPGWSSSRGSGTGCSPPASRLADPQSLAQLARTLDEAGVRDQAGRAPPSSPTAGCADMIRFDDPFGNTLELFCGARPGQPPGGQPVRQPLRHRRAGPRPRRAAGPRRRRRPCASTPSVLGFRLRDSMRLAPQLVGRRAGGDPAVDAVPGLQPAPPQRRVRADPGAVGHRPRHDRGRRPRRRRPGVRPVPQARRAAGHHPRPARQRPHGLVLRADPGGFDIEYGTDGLLVDDATWVSRETTAHSRLGPPVPSRRAVRSPR